MNVGSGGDSGAGEAGTIGCRNRPVRGIVGIPADLCKLPSSRRNAIKPRYEELVADFQLAHDHEPTTSEHFPFSSVRLSTPAKLDQNQARQPNNAPTGAITPPHTSADKPSWTQCWQTHSQHANGPGWRSHRIGSSHKPPP